MQTDTDMEHSINVRYMGLLSKEGVSDTLVWALECRRGGEVWWQPLFLPLAPDAPAGLSESYCTETKIWERFERLTAFAEEFSAFFAPSMVPSDS